MPCYTPLKAYRASGGGIAFDSKRGFVDRPISIRCGQCIDCRMARSREWALRCVHEAQLHERNCFITLTYNQEHVPKDGGLVVKHWQDFAKRARHEFGPFRFFHCGEYGDKNFRPHYHACLFGIDFPDQEPFQKTGDRTTYTSPSLDEKWGMGFCTVGEMNFESAAYVARYCMKKATGKHAKNRYFRIDLDTGDAYFVKPEYITMSRRPGLGANWLKQFASDVYPSDFIIHEGKKHRPPKFYDKRKEAEDPQEYEGIAKKRRDHVTSSGDYTEERLKTKELIQRERLKRLQREI